MVDLSLDVDTSPVRDVTNGGQFSPTTSTLLTGPTEAVLVDTQYMESDVAELARRITASGRTLTTIYITHAHADHYFGLEWSLDRFPKARAVALASVSEGPPWPPTGSSRPAFVRVEPSAGDVSTDRTTSTGA